MSTFDIALKSFTDYKHNYVEHPYSESDTRSKNIDFIFKDVLGWGEENIRREGNIDSGYFDYIFSLNNFKFVVEAKKSAVDFNLPIKGRRHKIGSIEKLNPSFVKQIRGYITDCSLSFGVLTNGKQFIIGRFNNNDGNDWILNDCVVFQNLDIIESHFSEFYNILSKEAIEVNGRFKIQTINEFRRSIYEDLPHKNKELIRNDFSGKLLPIIDKIFNEIGKTREGADLDLLKQCYIPSLDIHKHTEELRNLFIDLPPNSMEEFKKLKILATLQSK